MKLKRFEALTLQEALQAVKAELGPEAVIVSSRRVNKNGGLFGLLTQTLVEVTAAVDRVPTPEQQEQVERQKKETAVRNLLKRESPEPPRPLVESPMIAGREAPTTFEEQLRVAQVLNPVTEQLSVLREEMKGLREGNGLTENLIHPLRQEIASLRSFVDQALTDQQSRRASSLPQECRECYQLLVSRGVSSDLSYRLVRSVAETLGQDGLAQGEVMAEILREKMEHVVLVSGPLVTPGGLQKVVMLVGPTGVGKTTTIAKLASHFTQGPTPVKTVMITLDTYRVAAVEQLRVYARILKVPVEVAVTPEEVASSIARHQDAGLILVDTAGRSPQDPAGHQELSALAHQDVTVETHLVLAAPTDGLVLQDVLARYQALPIHRLIFTKLDEARQIGNVFNLIHHAGLPVSYLSAGQRVPEDLEQATGRALVERMELTAVEEALTKEKSLAPAGAVS